MFTPEWLSEPAETLFEELKQSPDPYDIVIVGSGYGGSVAAARLTACKQHDGRPLTVCVLERGREHVPGTFPDNASELPGHVRVSRFDSPEPNGAADGLFDLRIGQDVSVLVANGLGGGSLINAGVAARAEPDVFKEGWPRAIQAEWDGNKPVFEQYYNTALGQLRAGPSATERKLGKSIEFFGSTSHLTTREANITVSYSENPNIGCNDCGNCATGCNVPDAKNTLSTSYLADAWKAGAQIYTGVTVSHVAKRDAGWDVFVALTTPGRPLEKKPLRSIRARHVILSAGSLGSTEILMRSKELTRLTVSPCLGSRFSTNGDMISAMYKRKARVNASREESIPLEDRKVGPTITGIACIGDSPRHRIVFEDLAVPGALHRVFGEIVTTSAMLDELGRHDRESHRPFSEFDPRAGEGTEVPRIDPAAVDPEIVAGCQVVASMGNDGANGTLQLVPEWNGAAHAHQVHDGAIRVHWPDAGNEEVFKRQDELLRGIAEKDGWTYLPSPLWQPLPSALSSSLSGQKPSGTLLSVHPLGGCPMADDAADGVVDHIGRVFSGLSGNGTHDGLLVLDGSIIPTALGINPLLTITALAERGIEKYIALQRWTPMQKSDVRQMTAPPQIKRELRATPVTAVQFSERMTGDLRLAHDSAPTPAELMISFGEIKNLAGFLANPLHPLCFTGTLRFPVCDDAAKLTSVQVAGKAQLLVRGARGRWTRIFKALLTYVRTRALADIFGNPRALRPGNVLGVLKAIPAYLAVASNVGELRYMFYEMTLLSDAVDAAQNRLPKDTTLRGRKTLEYAKGANPWRQLVDLELTAEMPGAGRRFHAGTLSADVSQLLEGFASPLQITAQRDLPAAWMDLASVGLFFARVMLKIHFWNFRLPKYQKYDPMRDTRRLPGALDPLHMERYVVGPESRANANTFLLLTRYRRDKEKAGSPVLLIHGLGSGGIQFATARVNPNLAQYLAGQDFDVWVAELRTSIALPSSVHQWTLDQVARGDIPRLVDFVLKTTGTHQVDVVAHCIGSAMFCTAALDGRLQRPSGESKIRRAALMQVGPLIKLSKGTRLRALATAPLVRLFPDGFVDFSVDDRAGWAQSAIDRILNTYPNPRDEAEHHRLGIFDNPHIANCNRWAAIDGLMIRHENLSDEMLDNLGEVLGHSNVTTWAQPIQAGLLGRLTDSDGSNAYVTDSNVRERFRFPVLFLHGSDNDVFDPLTSYKSRELLHRVHGVDFPARVKILEGYRHIDPLIGRDAAQDVFRHIADFLNEKIALPERDATVQKDFHFRRPMIGPLIGWLRYDKGPWQARVWCRLDDRRSPVTSAAIQVHKKGGHRSPQVQVIRPKKGSDRDKLDLLIAGPIDTLLCADVTLEDGPGDYEISVLSAHEAAAGSVPDDYLGAERRTGKRASERDPHLTLKGADLIEAKLSEAMEFKKLLDKTRRPYRDGAHDDKIDTATISVPESEVSDVLTFAVASCRYPGWLVDRKLADSSFGELLERLKSKDGRPSALFLIGDQIYSDATAGVFDPTSRKERFYDAYREAWTAPNAQAVLSRLPVYMMMDDHEAGDDWHPDDCLRKGARSLRREGLRAFAQYQWLHSPGNRPPHLSDGPHGPFWYDFELHGFPVFVCDTRSGRSGRDRILDKAQFEALKDWLRKNSDVRVGSVGQRPKIVVSPSVLVPFRKPLTPDGTLANPGRSDSWDGFPAQLVELFSFIAREEIGNVAFLCGDSHLSMQTDIWFADERGERRPFGATCIMASPMYGPYPFVNATKDEFVFGNSGCSLKLPSVGSMHYKVRSHAAGNRFTVVKMKRTLMGWEIESAVLPHAEKASEQPGPSSGEGGFAVVACT